MPDRPAAELLAELPYFYKDDDKLSMRERQYRDVLERLARAEQALAEIEARPDGLCSFGMCRCSTSGVPCYARTSQGGQT